MDIERHATFQDLELPCGFLGIVTKIKLASWKLPYSDRPTEHPTLTRT